MKATNNFSVEFEDAWGCHQVKEFSERTEWVSFIHHLHDQEFHIYATTSLQPQGRA